MGSRKLERQFLIQSAKARSNPSKIFPFLRKLIKENPPAVVLDILLGMRKRTGERDVFRYAVVEFFKMVTPPDIVTKMFLTSIPRNGRWDDVVYLWEHSRQLEKECLSLISDELDKGNVYLAKWMPSINTSSAKTRHTAYKLSLSLGMTKKEYRKRLSELRSEGEVVESLISRNRWDEVDYSKVPLLAMKKYTKAFKKRDCKRFYEYKHQI